MAIESTGHSRGSPRLYELVEHTPKEGHSPTIWEWPQLIDWFKVAGQPVPGPWPPHQEARPDPEAEAVPVAVSEPEPEPRGQEGGQEEDEEPPAAQRRQAQRRTGGGSQPGASQGGTGPARQSRR